ncbi:ATPase (plasmid) [Cylindrospermum sp. NIES-4074]|nr:ATPase [Cylindrospermum sp. NIES-4074]
MRSTDNVRFFDCQPQGQASRRGLDIHFPRYLFQHEQDRQDFQGVLLALLKQVPLQVEIPTLMQHWFYFYERSIGCVGVLKDWLIRAVAAALRDGADTLTLELAWQNLLEKSGNPVILTL